MKVIPAAAIVMAKFQSQKKKSHLPEELPVSTALALIDIWRLDIDWYSPLRIAHITFAAQFVLVLKFNHAVSTVGVAPVPAVPVVNLEIASKVVENFVLGAHPLGVCQVAAVDEVAVNT